MIAYVKRAPHLHRCHFHRLGGDAEQCRGMYECTANCTEDGTEACGFCPEHERLAQQLERILDNVESSR